MSSPSPARPAVIRCPDCSRLNRVDLGRLSDVPKCAQCHHALPLDRPLKVTDRDFDQVVPESAVPVLVDFYADWCGPCRAMAPILESFAKAQRGHVLVLKLDTEANPASAARFAIRGIPTVIAFRGGRELRRHVGLADAAVLSSLVA